MSTAAGARRNDPAWYTPDDLPAEVRAYDTPVDALGVGSAGKVGLLELGFAAVERTTRIVRQFHQLPLCVFHPLYFDAGWPAMAFVYMLQGGEGMLQGDRYRMDFTCGEDTAVHVTTQSHSKIYRMENNFATQIVNLTAQAGAFVEYLPDPAIPFQDSRFYQRISITVDPTATVITGETLLPGRVARGEVHAYGLYYTDIEAHAPDGTLLFADRLKLAPSVASPLSPGMFGPYGVLATFYVVNQRYPPGDLADRLYSRLSACEELLVGVTTLPNGCGVAVRLLGHTSAAVAAGMHAAWNEARLALKNVPAPEMRKC